MADVVERSTHCVSRLNGNVCVVITAARLPRSPISFVVNIRLPFYLINRIAFTNHE